MSHRPPTDSEAAERTDALCGVFDAYSSMAIATVSDGAPWVAKVFFVDDEPAPGRLDLCCCLLLTSRKLANLRRDPRVAFLVAGDVPDRWVQGVGRAEVVEESADAEAIVKRLEAKSPAAGPFLGRVTWRAVRIHVERAKLTDVSMQPPVAEFSFA